MRALTRKKAQALQEANRNLEKLEDRLANKEIKDLSFSEAVTQSGLRAAASIHRYSFFASKKPNSQSTLHAIFPTAGIGSSPSNGFVA